MKTLKFALLILSVTFLMSATQCAGLGTDTGNPVVDDNYGQCGASNARNGTITPMCVPTPAPTIHARYTCKKLSTCFSIDEETCYDKIMQAPGLANEIPVSADTFSELFKMYMTDKTVTYNTVHFQSCLGAIEKIACDTPIVQNALTITDGIVDYTNVHSMIHLDPSCKLIYSYK